MPLSLTVAIVEDDASARAALAGLVNALGCGTREFPDPIAFLSSRAPHEVHGLIADLRLPGMSGLALHERLRRDGRTLPTLILTAYPDADTRRHALEAGVADFLPKPVDPERLHLFLNALRR
ncbi:response regulator transcription factor [Ancylobacter lacus]|uniref:response regulator transcription factor n=1 Tax=Ancylobacter lacus TaxID=2579970 RepID=UPI001BD1BC1A|nr:response regulator [Ancylobacter lacus]MBS7540914.1 response regulator [Ancylobacter lacus]